MREQQSTGSQVDVSSRPSLRLACALLSGGLLLAASQILLLDCGGNRRLAWLGWWLYWIQPLVLLVACAGMIWSVRGVGFRGVLRWLERQAWLLAAAALATALVATFVAPEMRMQFDETSLVGVSQNMHLQRLAVLTTGAIPFEGAAFPLQSMVDKRPTLFAFLVSLIHDVSGYRVANAFWLNGMLLFAGFVLIGAAVRARLGVMASLTVPALLLALPLTTVVATSAGFELLAVVLLAATIVAALRFVARPSDASCALLLGCGVLFAHARYESLLAIFVIGSLVVFAVWRRYWPTRRVLLLLAICPTLLAPLWPLLLHGRDPRFTPEANGEPLFALTHLFEHAGPLLRATLVPCLDRALVGPVGGVGLLVWGVRVVSRRAGRTDLYVGLPVLALTLLMLAWFYGDVTEVTAQRLFLPLGWLLVLLPLAAVAKWSRLVLPVFAASIVLAGLSIRGVATRSAYPELRIATLTRELDRAVERLPGDPATTLWVGATAQHLIVKQHAAVSVRTFSQLGQQVTQLFRQGDLRQVYLVETSLDRDMAPELGSMSELIRRVPTQVVERIGGAMPITVRRLAR